MVSCSVDQQDAGEECDVDAENQADVPHGGAVFIWEKREAQASDPDEAEQREIQAEADAGIERPVHRTSKHREDEVASK